MTSADDVAWQGTALGSAYRHLERDPRPAVVLERLAFGGGATRWYLVASGADLARAAAMMSPGSAVSFYFDGRVARTMRATDVRSTLPTVIARDGDALLGRRGPDAPVLDMEVVSGPVELAELLDELGGTGVELFYGPFPARDNDGDDAITVDLPDRDGVVRAHPH